MGKLNNKFDYENLRNTRILENKARLESLGIRKALSDIRTLTSSSKPERKKWTKRVYETTIVRRSDRLKGIRTLASSTQYSNNLSLRRSNRLKAISTEPVKAVVVRKVDFDDESEEEEGEKRPANAPFVKLNGAMEIQLSLEASARRCLGLSDLKALCKSSYMVKSSMDKNILQQKTLCGEEDCKRCSNLDPDQTCIGKTDCSVCHSANGVLCRGCLKVRYGEGESFKNLVQDHIVVLLVLAPLDIRLNKPGDGHSQTPKTKNVHRLIGNIVLVSFYLNGIKAREMGYKSVAHLLMDELQRRNKLRG
ncbi:unnamed protein product [Dovyalis caffra]|uniref:Zinc-finger domain-containing protein n=1 Tax=Dovyalis caffra TaxID=77055 RepID=A0AAV1SDV5_9ROSI|nr:unnamed protein product [Dovyalis caffra]